VRRIDIATARAVIEEYEWLGCMPAIVLFAFGIYFGPDLGGVVAYSPEYGENLGVWDKYGYTGKIITLSRGACTWWAHPHSASKLIRGSMKLLPPRYEVVTATVDAAAGEVGTIYQACNFDYVQMDTNARNGAIINGKTYTARSIRREFGSGSLKMLRERFGAAAVVPLKEKPKGRYFAFRGGKVARKHNRAMIKPLIKPYPHRDVSAEPAVAYEGLPMAA
jgi:hypothetical protein